ncbi:NADH-ubiquinone oxidoreductase-F iron-sulfur binding region domain-containing protein, partial [Vibrio parahaemolyticus]
ALAYELEELAFGRLRSTRRQPADRIAELCDLVEGRGACRHPDGAARLVRSALAAFPQEVHQHQSVGPCPEVAAAPFLPTGSARRS